MTFFSANHSPSTVNMKAKLFVIGTIKLISASQAVSDIRVTAACAGHGQQGK